MNSYDVLLLDGNPGNLPCVQKQTNDTNWPSSCARNLQPWKSEDESSSRQVADDNSAHGVGSFGDQRITVRDVVP